MSKKYVKCGCVVEFDGVRLLATQTHNNKPTCGKCYFSDHYRKVNKLPLISCYLHGFDCNAFTRRDNRHVVFVKQ